MRSLALIAGLASLAGCATGVPEAPVEQDRRAKQFQPSPNTGTIYFYSDLHLNAPNASVRVGDDIIGALGKGQFLIAEASPGRHVVFTDDLGPSYPLEIEVEAGAIYFIAITYEASYSQTFYLMDLVSAEEGRSEVSQRDLARLYPVGIVRAVPIKIVD